MELTKSDNTYNLAMTGNWDFYNRYHKTLSIDVFR